MTWNKLPSVLLVCEDGVLLAAMAGELRASGCRVLCARDLEEAAALIRAGAMNRFMLVRLGDDLVEPAELRLEMEARLPEWTVDASELRDEVTGAGVRAHRLVN